MAAIRLCSSATCRCCSAIRLKSWECCRRLCCTALVSWGWELTGTETGGWAASNGEAAGGEAGGAVGAIWFLNAIILNNFSCSALAFWTAAVSLGLMASNVEPSRILNPPSGSAMYLIWKKTREIVRTFQIDLILIWLPFATSSWDRDKCKNHELLRNHHLLVRHSDLVDLRALFRPHMHI